MSLPAIPRQSPVTGPNGLVGDAWDLRFLVPLVAAVNAAPESRQHVALTGQTASLSATAFVPATAITAAVYRVSYAIRVTTAATSSSSLTVTAGWTAGAVAQSSSGAALTGNTTATQQSGSFLVKADGGTAITYAVTYASTGATAMAYELDVILEQMP
jgi:hypothetical protein